MKVVSPIAILMIIAISAFNFVGISHAKGASITSAAVMGFNGNQPKRQHVAPRRMKRTRIQASESDILSSNGRVANAEQNKLEKIPTMIGLAVPGAGTN